MHCTLMQAPFDKTRDPKLSKSKSRTYTDEVKLVSVGRICCDARFPKLGVKFWVNGRAYEEERNSL